MSLIENMQSEYEKKKQELTDIQIQIPLLMEEVKKLTAYDTQMRQRLASASEDFSEKGRIRLQEIYDEANKIHYQLLKSEEDENALIKRRNNLELELKRNQFYISQAEHMAQQLVVSLSYLQTGISHLTSVPEENSASNHSVFSAQYMSFLKSIENEKLHIARDIHDGPAQQIASAQMRVDFCKTVLRHDLEKGLKILDQLKADLASSLTEVRNILFNLTPAPLEKMGLKGSIENLLNTILDSEKTQTAFHFELYDIDIEQGIETTIYRIVQELINNIKKHANASQVALRLSSSDKYVYIHMVDDGKGFYVPEDLEEFSNAQKSFGLANIYTRIKDLDGHLKITSQLDKGTVFKIQLPV
ncbi:MAG: sensor histidine kinase, partial [Clostridia bacterium]|nr:sensor histidine kinase [Clostridia bacterium]